MKKRFLICCICLVCIMTMSAFAAEPEILAQPQSVYLPENTELPVQVSFAVLASGDDLTYQWQGSSDGGSTWTNVTGITSATTATLSIRVLDYVVNGGRMYRCVVSSSDSSVTTQAVSVAVSAFTLNSLPQMLQWVQETTYSIFDWVGSSCTTIVEQPLLLFTVGFLALGGCIALVGRLLSRS